MESVVGNGDDGFVGTAEIFHSFPLKNWEWDLSEHKGMLERVKSVIAEHVSVVAELSPSQIEFTKHSLL